MIIGTRASRRARSSPKARLTAALLLGTACALHGAAAAAEELNYITVDFGNNSTFLTGIRGENIVGDYVIPDTANTGGLLYRSDTATWIPFPVETGSGINYPEATSSSPYGPSFGSPGGILRVVGVYKVEGSPYNIGYLYDSAAAPGETLLTLIYPQAPGGPATLFTFPHSTFGNTAVGDYDTELDTGNAFIYDISTGTFTTNNHPGAVSTTAYGVWGDVIAGGYGEFGPDHEPGFEHGYIYNRATDEWTTYDHPDALFTHFEGITGAGRDGEYNLVADYISGSGQHAAVLHAAADGTETWIPIEVPGAITTSANSIYEDKAIGIYTDATGVHGFIVTIPGIYNPIRNLDTIETDEDDTPAFVAGKGDDVVNDGIIRTDGANSSGIKSDTYGVVRNNGEVVVTGEGSAAIEMHGRFGTLLNAGIIRALPGAEAIRADELASGTWVVNYGEIDGRVSILAGDEARFENSSVFGISAAGAGTEHEISGIFAQTAEGVLSLRIGEESDVLSVGTGRLAGTFLPFIQHEDLTRRYTIITATDEITGEFADLDSMDMPSFLTGALVYSEDSVDLELEAHLGDIPGESRSQRAVGDALDRAFNSGGGIPDGLNAALFELDEDQVPDALDALSGEVHASERTVLFTEALYAREVLLGRLREATASELYDPKSPSVTASDPHYAQGLAVWAHALGAWTDIDGNGNASDVEGSYGGFLLGADIGAGTAWRLGWAVGYTRSETDIDHLRSSADADAALVAFYAGSNLGDWRLRGGGAYSQNFIDTTRAISFPGFSDRAEADYTAGVGQLFGEVGYATQMNEVALEPFAGLALVHVNTDNFFEHGGPAALTGDSSSNDAGFSLLGIRATCDHQLTDGSPFSSRLSLAWQHAFGDLTPKADLAFIETTGASFTVAGVPVAQDSALIEAGFDLQISPNAKAGLSYLGRFGDGTSVNVIGGQFSMLF